MHMYVLVHVYIVDVCARIADGARARASGAMTTVRGLGRDRALDIARPLLARPAPPPARALPPPTCHYHPIPKLTHPYP